LLNAGSRLNNDKRTEIRTRDGSSRSGRAEKPSFFGRVFALFNNSPNGDLVTLGPTEESFSQTDEPGIYTIESADESRLFAVNVSAKESRTAPMPVEDIEKLGVLLDEGKAVPSERHEEVRRQANLAEMEYENPINSLREA